jgi:hypothetical protein
MHKVGFEPTVPVFERAKTVRPLWSAYTRYIVIVYTLQITLRRNYNNKFQTLNTKKHKVVSAETDM